MSDFSDFFYIFSHPGDKEFIGAIQLMAFTNLELILLSMGVGFICFGALLLLIVTIYEHQSQRKSRKKALILHDALLIPPRCSTKCHELQMTTGLDWKDYFARDEPFDNE